MNILETITVQKRIEIKERSEAMPVSVLEKHDLFNRKTLSLKSFLLNGAKTGIIAEFKRRSPSKGIINVHSAVEAVTVAYTGSGASGLSVLTDQEFFGGRKEDLIKARVNAIPILRKDFIIDEYQVLESKAMGADVILLIAACLTPERVKELAALARKLDLEVLLEIHNEEELQHICDEIELVGVNNRDLKTFSVDLDRSIALAEQIPGEKVRIAESGINSVEAIGVLKAAGFRGFLMGEHFMKEADPGKAFRIFVEKMQITDKK